MSERRGYLGSGDRCPNFGPDCCGRLRCEEVIDCSCHISAPCSRHENAGLECNDEGCGRIYYSMHSVPKDGSSIYILQDDRTEQAVMWSQRPVCMGGPMIYQPPGWSTSWESGTDTNLPVDIDNPIAWRE